MPPTVKARAYFYIAREFVATNYLRIYALEESMRLDPEFGPARVLLAAVVANAGPRAWGHDPLELCLAELRRHPGSASAAAFIAEQCTFRHKGQYYRRRTMSAPLLEALSIVSRSNPLRDFMTMLAEEVFHLYSLTQWSPRRHMCIDRHYHTNAKLATLLMTLNRLVAANIISDSDPCMWETMIEQANWYLKRLYVMTHQGYGPQVPRWFTPPSREFIKPGPHDTDWSFVGAPNENYAVYDRIAELHMSPAMRYHPYTYQKLNYN